MAPIVLVAGAMMSARIGRVAAMILLTLGAAACASEEAPAETKDNLYSITGEPRRLTFSSYVYVNPNDTDQDIYGAIKRMNQSAFGALRTANIGVNTRELAPGGGQPDPVAFVRDPVRIRREPVRMIDPGNPNDPGYDMIRVRYTYEDDAIVPDTVPDAQKIRSAISAAVLSGYYFTSSSRILRECTTNTREDIAFESSIWYVFNPSLSQCQAAMKAEQQSIDADRARLTDARHQVPKSEVYRLYVPITVRLASAQEGTGQERPEYDRLYAGGVARDRLVIGMVNGKMADWAVGEQKESIDDDGYGMYFEGLAEIFKSRKFSFVGSEPAEDFTKLDVGGRIVDVPGGFMDIYGWETKTRPLPTGVDARALRVAAGKKIAKHWIKLESSVEVKTGDGPARNVTIALNTYVEAESDEAPHRKALKESDVFVYNGHSYIGYGPLDPSRYRRGDLPQSYQLFFVNGCVSYNYYEKDYVALKERKTKDLDLITNGLESWVNGSGPAMGRFVARLIDGKQATYQELLDAAQFEERFGHAYEWGDDALRVVDGELDNEYDAARTPIVVSSR